MSTGRRSIPAAIAAGAAVATTHAASAAAVEAAVMRPVQVLVTPEPALAEADGAQPFIAAEDWPPVHSPVREPGAPRLPRARGGDAARLPDERRGQGRTGDRDDFGRDPAVVGFGAETPAFLLRAAPIAPIRKTAVGED